MNNGLLTSLRDDWGTPQHLFASLNREFNFTVDVCATEHNAKCKRFYSPKDDGLSQEWAGVCWCNPPYGRQIGRWIQKAWESSQQGATVVCLVPSRTDTAWWHNYAMRGEIRFIQGRLYFGDGTGRAPFPSAIVVFRP